MSVSRALRRRVFGISPNEADLDRRGFEASDACARTRLEDIGRTFIDGYHAALVQDADGSLGEALDAAKHENQGVVGRFVIVERLQDPPNPAIKSVHHRAMDAAPIPSLLQRTQRPPRGGLFPGARLRQGVQVRVQRQVFLFSLQRRMRRASCAGCSRRSLAPQRTATLAKGLWAPRIESGIEP